MFPPLSSSPRSASFAVLVAIGTVAMGTAAAVASPHLAITAPHSLFLTRSEIAKQISPNLSFGEQSTIYRQLSAQRLIDPELRRYDYQLKTGATTFSCSFKNDGATLMYTAIDPVT